MVKLDMDDGREGDVFARGKLPIPLAFPLLLELDHIFPVSGDRGEKDNRGNDKGAVACRVVN